MEQNINYNGIEDEKVVINQMSSKINQLKELSKNNFENKNCVPEFAKTRRKWNQNEINPKTKINIQQISESESICQIKQQMNEFKKIINNLEKENFNLKRIIHHLETKSKSNIDPTLENETSTFSKENVKEEKEEKEDKEAKKNKEEHYISENNESKNYIYPTQLTSRYSNKQFLNFENIKAN